MVYKITTYLTVASDIYDFIELTPYHRTTAEDNFHHVINCHAFWKSRDYIERRLADVISMLAIPS